MIFIYFARNHKLTFITLRVAWSLNNTSFTHSLQLSLDCFDLVTVISLDRVARTLSDWGLPKDIVDHVGGPVLGF